MVHAIRLPRKFTVYPRGYTEDPVMGFVTGNIPKETFVRIPKKEYYSETARDVVHEMSHKVYNRLSEKERQRFIEKMGKVKKIPDVLKWYAKKSWSPQMSEIEGRIKKGELSKRKGLKMLGELEPSKLMARETFPRMATRWVVGEE